MAFDPGIETELADLEDFAQGKGQAVRAEACARRLMLSSVTNFGPAALKHTGDTADTIPVLGAGGLLAKGLLPAVPASLLSAARGVLAVARVGVVNAARVTSGVFRLAQIPALDASRLVRGRLGIDQIPDSRKGNTISGSTRTFGAFTYNHQGRARRRGQPIYWTFVVTGVGVTLGADRSLAFTATETLTQYPTLQEGGG